MLNGRQKRDLVLLVINIAIVAANTLWFRWIWYKYYFARLFIPFVTRGNIAVIAVFIVVYSVFTHLYGGFDLTTSRTRELVYSHVIASGMTGVVMYVILWLLIRYTPQILPMLLAILLWSLTSVLWSKPANLLTNMVYPPARTIIIYENTAAFYKGDQITARVNWRFKVIGKIDATKGNERVFTFIKTKQPEAVMLCGIHSSQRNDILKYCIDKGILVYIRPNIGDYIVNSSTQLQMASLPVMLCQRANPSVGYLLIKRIFDIFFSLAIMIVFSPLILITAILIKSYDRGPVLYSQVRLTKDGKSFRIYKFRSMKVNAESDGVARLASQGDDRITPVGRFIRATRIDELPQMINILKGDMSVVGPRPERPELTERYEKNMPEFTLRMQVKAGLTGYAQVHGKYNTSPYDKLQMDLMYIAKQSIATDFRIILETVKVVFMPESTEGIGEGETDAEEHNV